MTFTCNEHSIPIKHEEFECSICNDIDKIIDRAEEIIVEAYEIGYDDGEDGIYGKFNEEHVDHLIKEIKDGRP